MNSELQHEDEKWLWLHTWSMWSYLIWKRNKDNRDEEKFTNVLKQGLKNFTSGTNLFSYTMGVQKIDGFCFLSYFTWLIS